MEFSLNDAVDNKVFDLPKSSDKEKKKFSFLVTIKYRNISKTVTKETDSFYLIGTDNKRQSSGKHLYIGVLKGYSTPIYTF